MKFIAIVVVVLAVDTVSASLSVDNLLSTTIGNVVDIVALNSFLGKSTDVRSFPPKFNKLTRTLTAVFTNITDAVHDQANVLSGTDLVGTAVKNVEKSLIELIQTANFAVLAASKSSEDHVTLLSVIGLSILDLSVTVEDLFEAVISVVSNISGKITNPIRKALNSLLSLFQKVLEIVVDVSTNVLAVLRNCGLTISNVVSRITSRLSSVARVASKSKSKTNGDNVQSRIVSFLNNILEKLSKTVKRLTGIVVLVAGGLTGVLFALKQNLEPLPDDVIAPIAQYVFEAVIGALNAVFDQINKAVTAVDDRVIEAVGLLDVAIRNVKTAVGVVFLTIGSITSEGVKSAGKPHGIADHLKVAIVQLLTDSSVKVLIGTLRSVAESSVGVSGTISGTLSGLTGTLSSLSKGLISDRESVGTLSDLVGKSDERTAVDALKSVASNVAHILKILNVSLATLGDVNALKN